MQNKLVLEAIRRHNQRAKQIKLYAKYAAGQYDVITFLDYDQTTLLPIYSITKALTCAVVLQLAEQRGLSLNRPLLDDLPYEVKNDAFKQLTVAQFANMTTGIDWHEIDSYQRPNNTFEAFVRAAEPLDYLFSRPLNKSAGFIYNSAATHALAHWAAAVSGQSFELLVAQMLFEPLQIERYQWQRDAAGCVYGGHGLALTGDDFIKLLPLLASGYYGAKKVLDGAVIKRLQQQVVARAYGRYGYGFGLWHGKIKNAPFIGAFGNAGQRIYYFPTLKQSHAFLGNTKPEFGIQEAILKHII